MAEGQKQRIQSEENVKLFVGQVPKHMTETQLLAMFKEFALVDEVNIIKDKITRASRGSLHFACESLLFFDFYQLLILLWISVISRSQCIILFSSLNFVEIWLLRFEWVRVLKP